MSSFLFCFLIALWTITLIQTYYFVSCLLVIAFVVCTFLVCLKQPKIQLPKTLLATSKTILAISFWSCVAFCLFDYQKSISCMNCIRHHLSENDSVNMSNLWHSYARFIVISGLFILWAVAFISTKKRIKAND